MSLTVTTPAPTVLLTTRARVAQEIEVSVSDQAIVDRLIRDVSAAIVRWCHRPFHREAVTETLPGYGDLHLQLSRTPIAAVSQVLFESSSITDYSIESPMEGTLYRAIGWAWTAQFAPGLSGRQRWPGFGAAMPRSEEPDFSVAYTGGYILPPQNHVAATTISVDDADDSFNDSASGFPSLLKAGDMIETSGFAAAANNGRFIVTGTPTTAKVVVSASLTTAVAGASVNVSYPEPTGLPLDVEKAAVEAVKTWFQAREDDSRVVEKQLGPARVRFQEDLAGSMGLPPLCVGLLRPWRRAA